VISSENGNGNAAIAYFGQFTQQPDKSSWNNLFVVKPKIKNIAQ